MIDVMAILKRRAEELDHIEAGQQAIESCIEKLQRLEQTDYLGTLYRTDYEVEGVDEFPIDMLRYTCSWPAREEDYRAIEASMSDSAIPEKRTVRLTRSHRDPLTAGVDDPLLAGVRWFSKFRWRVVRVVDTRDA